VRILADFDGHWRILVAFGKPLPSLGGRWRFLAGVGGSGGGLANSGKCLARSYKASVRGAHVTNVVEHVPGSFLHANDDF
jgi:hypothetical protein